MADGSIKIAIEVDGKQVNIAADSLKDLESAGRKSGDGAKQAEDGLKGVSSESKKASGNIKKFAKALGLVAIGTAAFNELKNSVEAAISRFDTLNTFPAVLQALGVSAEDSERSISNLSDGIDGLPTKLDDIANVAQRMFASFSNMDEATDSALALNNALLGSGASVTDAQRGTDQYLQALQRGKFEMEEWKTLQETMNVGLVEIAKGFGFAGTSATNDLYQALKDGDITMQQFNDRLIEVGTGTGIMAKLAKENSAGIATSFGNLRNAAAKGIANIIKSFDELSKEVTGNSIAENIDGLKNVVNASFSTIQSVIKASTPIVVGFASAVKGAIPVIDAMSPVLIGMAAAFAVHKVISVTTTAMKANTAAMVIATVAQNTFTIATNRLTLALALAAVKTKVVGIALAAYNTIVGLATAAQALLASGMSFASVAAIGLSGAISILGTSIKVLTGPVGWVTAGVGALAGAVVGIVKWFNKASEEGERLTEETEKLAEASDSLNESIDDTSRTYDSNIERIENNAKANEELANKILELSAIEKKSADDKKLLEAYTEELNNSVAGLNLVYGEETNALNMSSEKIMERIGLLKEQEQMQASQERLTEIIKEQVEVEGQLEEINLLREEWNQKLDDGSVKSKEHKEALAELEEQEKALGETNKAIGEERIATEEQLIESSNAVATAQEENTGKQLLLFEELSESQQTTVENMKTTWEDYKNAATDMFDTLSDEAELTVSEMASNLEENQRIIGEWSTNIATLAERGVDEGLLNTLRDAGPESAGHVNALVNASDTELERLSEAFANGGDTATDALTTSLGIEESGVLEAVGHLVIDTEQALAQQIQAANFSSIGTDVTDGLAGGIEDGTAGVEDASQNMADNATIAAKKAFQTRSPSKVFKGIGGDVADGLALGISDGTTKVTQAIQNMFQNVIQNSNRSFQIITNGYNQSVSNIDKSLKKLPLITQKAMQNMLNRMRSGASSQMTVMSTLARNLPSWFNGTPSQFRSIGINAMAGLNAGLNAGRGRVLSTARSIANSVASTMKKALDIHSPSRKMKNEVGRWIPEGIALGIRDNAKSVYKELDNLSNNMIMTSTPEQAIGASRMAYSSGSNFVKGLGNGVSNPVTNNTVNMNGLFEGANFEVRNEHDIPRLAKELGDYVKMNARKNGVIIP